MGLEHTDYSVEEGQEVRVCARLMTSRGSCIVSFPFSVVVNTEYGSGMKYIVNYSYSPCPVHHSCPGTVFSLKKVTEVAIQTEIPNFIHHYSFTVTHTPLNSSTKMPILGYTLGEVGS